MSDLQSAIILVDRKLSSDDSSFPDPDVITHAAGNIQESASRLGEYLLFNSIQLK